MLLFPSVEMRSLITNSIYTYSTDDNEIPISTKAYYLQSADIPQLMLR